MHVVQISFFVDSALRPGNELLAAWGSLVDVADAARCGGARVTVLQAAAADETIEYRGIKFHFLRHERGAAPLAGRSEVRALLDSLSPDVVHVHGLGFSREVLALRAARPAAPILLQDHADRVPRFFWRRPAWRRGLAAANGLAFCALEQARLMDDAMQLPAMTRVFEVPESTSRFVPGDRAAARAETGVSGDPCLLWVGHLVPNKDPFTVLDGVSRAARELPGLRLWCCFGSAPLRAQIERRIAADPNLTGRVTLMGTVPHARVERLMQAADLFVLGSRREGSGYSVIEALATGLPVVVTDIPSFRSLVGDGSQAGGELWPCGDAAAFAAALARCARRTELRAAARHRFETEVSFEAVGRKLTAVYGELART